MDGDVRCIHGISIDPPKRCEMCDAMKGVTIYKMAGKFHPDCTWDDFVPENESFPSVTIGSGDKEDIDLTSADGWIDVTVTEFTKENCLTALEAIVNGPVKIIETGSCISV